MKLYIRSQDKCRLVPKPNLYAVFDKNNNIAYIGDKVVGHIGKYKSLERALEVLDEIQNILMPPKIIINETFVDSETIKYLQENNVVKPSSYTDIKQLDTYVYELPKE